MASQDKIIADLLKTIDMADQSFIDALPQIQKEAFARVVKLSGELDLYADGSIKSSVKNLTLLGKIKQQIDKVIFNKTYQQNLFNFQQAFNDIELLQQQYFTTIAKEFSPGKIFDQIKKQSIELVTEQLNKNALSVNISTGVRDILKTNITSGAKFSDLVDNMRNFLTDSETGEGAMAKYAKTITTDALNTYSRVYDQLATDDLGLTFFQYTGSLRQTSRAFCKAMIEAKSSGMEYIHRSQFKELLHGNVNGKKVPINDKTGLPYGFKEETNESNFQQLSAGYSCNHSLKPVSSAIVPKALREKFE